MHLTKLLEPSLVGDKLGQMKHEGTAVDAVYLAPKVYSLIMEDGSEICKIKGSNKKLPFSVMKSLILKDSEVNVPQERWKRSLAQGKITLLAESVYTLGVTTEKKEGSELLKLGRGQKPAS